MRTAVGILVVSGCAAIAAPAWAHHSMVAYERTRETTTQGVITEVKWQNPHMFIIVAVPAGGR